MDKLYTVRQKTINSSFQHAISTSKSGLKSKIFLFLIGFILSAQILSAQVFLTESFEAAVGTAGSGGDCSCVSTNVDVIDNISDYFARTDGSTIEANGMNSPSGYTGQNGTYFWAGEDHDDGQVGGSGNQELSFELTGINIAGKTDLKFNALFAANDIGNAYDVSPFDFVRVEYRIDGGTYTTGLQFSYYTADGGTTEFLKFDTDFNGAGDAGGAVDTLYENFQPYSFLIPGTGNSMDIRVTAHSNSSSEEWAIDHIQIEENAASTPLAANITIDNAVDCSLLNNGGLTASGSGGTSPYTFLWSTGATTASISGLSIDTYTVTVTDNSGTTATASEDIGQVFCYGNNESDMVAFELCPSAGMAVEADILQGSFDNFDNLTVYEGASGSGTSGNLLFGPSSGDLSGMTISGSVADQCLIFVVNSNSAISCADGSEDALEICSEDITATNLVTFTALADLCIDAGVQAGLGGGIPTGGVYSGSGVTDGGNGMTYSFNPVTATAGVHTLTYTQGGNAAMDDVEVFALATINFTAPADLCIDAGVQTGLGGGTPTGGVYSGPGITDDANGMTYSFNPALAGLGVHTITYTLMGGCTGMATDDIEVLAACGCPVGQTSHFNCYNNNETNLVIFEVCPTAGMAAQATINSGSYESFDNLTVYQGLTGSGASGSILFGPSTGDLTGTVITGNLANNCLIFVNNTNGSVGCLDGNEDPLSVCGESIMSSEVFTALADVCITDGVQTNLSGGSPTGGVYSGSGVTDDGNGMTYTFDPATAMVGVHTLTYTIGGNAVTDDVEVFAVPTVSYTAPADVCLDEGEQTNLGGGTPTGGVYSGPGVTDNGNGLSYSFDPAAAGIGTHTITYTEGSACMATATDDIEVTAACSCPAGEMTYFNCYDDNESNLVIFEVCPTAGMFAVINITQGAYDNGDFLTIYQGATGSGTGGTIVFGPSTGSLTGTNLQSTVADECLIFVSNSNSVASCSDGTENPLIVCGSSVASNVTFTALPDLSVNAGVQTGLSDGSPSGGVYSGPGVMDDGNGMTYTFDPAMAGIGVHTLTYTLGGNSATDDVEVFNLLPPSFSKSFSPTTIGSGAVTTLTFTIDNTSSGTPATSIDFTDNLPAGMTVAATPNISTNCFTGTVSAVAGSSTISFSGGAVTGNSFCTISVNVTSTTTGTNTTGDLTSSAGNSGTASANLTVDTRCPIFSKAFSPTTINVGERSTLTFTIDNTAGAVNLNSARFIDNLPAGMVVASPANVSVSCTNVNVTALPGSSVITVAPTINGQVTVAAGSSCTITVDVIGTSAGTLDNITDNFVILNNLFQTLNCGFASATLEVLTPPQVFIQKSFTTNPVLPGGTTNLEFTITNQSRDQAITNVAFTDDLTAVLAGLTATGTPLNNICGAGSQLSGTTMLSFTGGSLAAGASCTFSVPVSIPGGAAVGTYTNTTSAITATSPGGPVTGNVATANLFVAEVPTFTKTFLTNPILAGGTTTLEFTITNNSPTTDLTDITFTDNIAAFLSGASVTSLPAANSCGTSSFFFTSVVSGELTFTVIGANIPAGGSCTFSVDLTIPAGVPSATFTNTTSYLTADLGGQTVQAEPATDDLTILAVPRLSKSFTNNPVAAGGTANLEFTLTYDASASGDATAITFTDDLNAVIAGMSASGLPMNDVCGTGSSISGTTNLTLSNATLSPGSSCTFTVPVTVPAGTIPGVYTNTTSALSATVGGQAATGDAATDDLIVGGMTLTKEFIDDPVIPGGLTTLRFTLDNTTTFDATSIIFTDNLSTTLSGLVAEAPLPATPCGAGSAINGTSFLVFTGGNITAGNSCSFDVMVRVPANATSGTYNNTTSNLIVTLDGAGRTLPPASDNLVVEDNLIQLTKTFTDDPVAPGGTVTVEYTLTNLDATNAISNIAFTDDFDGLFTGLAATGLPMNNICGAGSSVSGTGLLSFAGGSLAAGASCTFSVTLQTPVSVPFGTILTCPTSSVTGDVGGLPVVGDPATDDLQIQSLSFTKAFSGSSAPGGTATITFTITNADPVNSFSDIAFTDDLDAFITGMTASNLPLSGICGAVSGANGTSVITFGRGELAAGANCSFSVDVTIPCGTAGGMYTNTTSQLTATSSTGGSITVDPATADLTVSTLDVSISAQTNVGCNGESTGSATAAGSGGTAAYTYAWSNSATTANITGLAAGTYTVSVTDANGCGPVTTTVTITEPMALVASAAVTSMISCNGDTDGQVTASQTGGTSAYTYSWNTGGTAALETGLGAGTYSVTITDANGCTDSASVVLTQPAALVASAAVTSVISCNGATDGQVTASQTGGTSAYTYSWNTGGTAALETGLGAGTYSVTITDANGCTDSASVVLTQPVALVASAAVTSMISCNGATDGQVTASQTGGTSAYTYSWNTGGTAALETGLGAGTYSVTITDANGCTDSASVVLTQPAALVASAAVTSVISCNGATDGQVTASQTGGTSAYTYSWNTGGTAALETGLGAGTYSVTITDANGCTDSASVVLTQPAVLVASAAVTSAISCNGATDGQVTASQTGGTSAYTYSWNTGGTAALETGLGAGTYSVTITDANGCTDSASVVLTQPAALVASAAVTSAISCNMATDGQVTASQTGGTSAYTYSWNTGGTAALETGLGAGTYSVTITDANGCTDSASVVLTQPIAVGVSITAQTNVACNGASTGSATAAGSGGTGAYTYTWSNAATTATINGLAAGTYTVSVTDANGCGPATTTVTITEPTAVGVSITAQTNVDCNGASTGSATAAGSGGTGAYTYAWSTSATTATINGLAAGTYTVSVTDANGCGPATTTVTITEPTAVGVSITAQTNVACNGASTGSATAAGSGGTGAYTYTWSNAATSATISGLAAGTYTVSVTDANGCGPATTTVTITEPTAVGVSITAQTNVACNGASTGSATAAGSGGTGAYTYAWSTSATTATINGLAAGTYTVSVTDANGCGPATTTVTITEPTAVGVSITAQTNVACNGASTGSATAAGSGGTGAYTYAWSNGPTTATNSGLAAGTYTVSVTDANGCGPATTTVTITEPTAVGVSITAQTNVACNGASTGSATAAGSGGTGAYTYAWSTSATTATINGLAAGTYTVSVTDANGCGPATTTVTITEPTAVGVSITAQTNVACNGASTGSATAAGSGGTGAYTYAWSTSATTATINGLAAGTYTVSVTDANGCGPATTTVTITEPTAVGVSITAQTNVACNGASTGSATAAGSGGTGAYTYAWSNSATTATNSGLAAGTYTVSVTDANGCGPATTTVTITEPTAVGVSITAQTNVACNGASTGSATAAGSGGTGAYTYAWSNAATTATINGLAAGTYTVSVTDANGCGPATTTVTITEPTAVGVSITAQTNVACNGASTGSATAAGSGGTGAYTYAWSNGPTTATNSGLAAGTYTVSVTDANGCGPATTTVTITEPTAVGVSITAQTNVDCNGASTGSATAAGSGGTGAYTYAWSNGPTTATNSGLAAGTYTVSVTDANGCGPATTTVTITEPTAVGVSITAQTNVACNGASTGSATAAGSGGTGAYTYAWSNGPTTATNSGLAAGTYTVSVTDANGCGPATTTVTITEPTAVGVSITAQTNVDCNGASTGSATAAGSGGTGAYTYAWSNAATTATINGLAAGTYTVSVTDANGCGPATTTVTITEPTAVGVSITAQTNVDCNGASTGSATAAGSGGTGAYTYAWSNGPTTATNSGLAAGTYTVSVTDANGCGPATTTVTITEPTAVGVSITAQTNVACNGASTGSATAAGSGGTGAYTYAWSNGPTTATNSGLAAGTYTVSVTDANGCGPATTTVTITEPTAVGVSITAQTNVDCNGAATGSATAAGSGGTGAYTYAWSNGPTTATNSGLVAGTYTVSVTDANGCGPATTTVTITEPAVLAASIAVDNNVSCFGFSDGALTASATGGTMVYTYAWSTGASTASITGLVAGTYTVTITDANGCVDSETETVTEPPLITVNLTTIEYLCIDAGAQANLSGGVPAQGTVTGDMGVYSGPGVMDDGNGMTYTFDPNIAGTGTHTITYMYTDDIGCSNTATGTIIVSDCGFDMTDPCICLNNASIIDLDAGTGGDDGQFGEIVSVEDAAGGMLPAGQTWTVVAQTGAFDAYNIPAIGMQSAGVPVATDGSVTMTHNAGNGMYELPFVHVDDIGYTISVEGPFPMGSAANVTIMIGNTCEYPQPVFDPALDDEYCSADPAVTLGGTDSNGFGADAIFFFINGAPATVFDPGALMPGMYTISMVFNGADDGNMGIAPPGGVASPGCIQNVQKVVNLLAGMPPTITCPADNFGLPPGCNVTPPPAATTFNIVGGPTPNPALPTVTDGCGTLMLTSNDVITDNGCIRTLTRTYTITDQAGDFDDCIQTFTWTVDTDDPTWDQALPMDATVECDAVPAPAVLTASDNCSMTLPVAFINEIHYDNTGTDVGEFIEIAGTAGFDLSTCELILYNGSNNMPYGMMSLSGMIDDEGAGFGAVSFSYPSNGLQNGSPDGVAFVCGGMVVDFISYEGTITAIGGPADGMTSTNIGTEPGGTPIGESLQLTGLAGCAAADFGWVGPVAESPGMINAGQTFDPALCMSSSSAMVTFMEMRVDGACANEYTLTRTWTATDGCMNSISHTQTLTIEDTTAPTFCDAPMSITQECDLPIPTAPNLTAIDNCDVSGYAQVVWINEFHYDNVGTDAGEFVEIGGVAGTDLATYELFLYNGFNGLVDRMITLSGTIDNESCNLGALSFLVTGLMNGSPDGMALVQNGTTVIEFISWEGSFLANDGPAMGMTSVDVLVSETSTTPVGQSLQLTGSGSSGPDFTWAGPAAASSGSLNTGQTAEGNLTPTFMEVITPGTCPQEMVITRTWDVMDACGNPAQHVQTITIEDTTNPVPVCQDITVELDANGEAFITAAMLNNGSTDNCTPQANLALSASRTMFTCADLNATCDGSVPVTLTVTDECGNSETCIANVFIQDNRAPIFSNCPGDFTVTLDPGDCFFIYEPLLAATDNCDTDVTITQTAGPAPGAQLDHGTVTRYTFEAEDNCGNITVCDYEVTVNEWPFIDTELACNNDVQISLDENCMATVGADLILEGGQYGCYDTRYTVIIDLNGDGIYDPAEGNQLNASHIGQTFNTQVTDILTGNSCWGSIHVEDKLIPDLECQDATALCSDDLSPEALGFPLPAGAIATANGDGTYTVTGFDVCSDAQLSYVDTEEDFNCQAINKVITRTWTVSDDSGNSNSCDQTINLTRATLADVIAPPNYDGIDQPALNCEDRCDANDTRFCGPDNLYWNVLPAGHQYAGHPNPESELWGCGTVKCFGTGAPSGASCGDIQQTFTDTRINVCATGPSDGCYKILREWTVLDWCTGDTRFINQIIKVEDTEGPEINDIDDVTISTDVWGCEADWYATEAWLQDNCSSDPIGYTVESTGGVVTQEADGRWKISGLAPGTYTITYVATDCCGNETRQDITLTVIDDVPPVVVCDAHTVVSLTSTNNINTDNLGLTKVFAHTFDDGSFDNCSSEVYFKAIRMDEFNSNGNTKNGEDVRLGDWASIDCDAANGDDDLRVFPPWYQGPQSYFDDHVKFCCDDINDGPIMVVLRVFDIDPTPYTFGIQFPNLVPAGENAHDYNGVLPEAMAVGGALYGHYSDCMVEVTVQDKLPPYVVAPPNITVTCDFWFEFDPDRPNDYTDALDGYFGKVVTGPGAADPINHDSIIVRDRVCEAHPRFGEYAPVSIFDDPCYDDQYDIFWGYDGYALDNCGLDLEQTIVPNLHCGRGSILRRWRASDPSGNWSNTATQRITIIDCKEWYVPTACWRFTPKDVSECDLVNIPNIGLRYRTKLIEWPCDVDITTCQGQGNGLDAFHPDNLAVNFEQDRRPRMDDDNCNLMASTYTDEVFTFIDGACFKIFRTWKVIDWCLYEDFQNGVYTGAWSWEWTQVIKLLNQTGPTFADCTNKTFCGNGDPSNPQGDQCVGVIELRPDVSDDCTPLEDLRIDYKLDLDNDGTYDELGYSDNYGLVYPFPNPNFLPVRRFAAELANADGTYPVGTHRILWAAEDGCGNTNICQYLFTIEDCKPPTAYCEVGVSTIAMPPIDPNDPTSGYVDIWASDFDLGSYDNCTAQENLIFSFSTDPNDRSRRLTCADAGQNLSFTVYVWDEAGNYSSCLVGVVLNDCVTGNGFNITGDIRNEEGIEVELVEVNLGGAMTDMEMTGIQGFFDFLNLTAGQNYTVTPEKDINPLNGVTTFDLVLMSKHILGIQSLPSPYKMIAADINKSGSITTFDMVELRKLILYIDTEFRSNTSWRFIEAAYDFNGNPSDPFASTLPEVYSINGLAGHEDVDFVGVKVGDVNCSADVNSLIDSEDRSFNGDLVFNIDDQQLKTGEEHTIDFLAKDFNNILGYQFSLNFNSSAIEYVGIEAGTLSKLDASNFGLALLDRGVITTSWNSNKAVALDDNAVAFSLTFRAKRDAQLSDLLSVSSDFTVAEAYNADAELMNVALEFNTGVIVSNEFELMQNQPNPFKDETVIGFNLPEAGAATLTIYDVSGRVLKQIKGDYAKGYNEESLNRSELSAAGVLYYTLETDTESATKRMIVVE